MEETKIEVKAIPQGLEMQIDRESFALALKTWRIRNSKLQREVAAAWGVSRETINRAERARQLSWQQAYRLFAHLAEELKKEAEK